MLEALFCVYIMEILRKNKKNNTMQSEETTKKVILFRTVSRLETVCGSIFNNLFSHTIARVGASLTCRYGLFVYIPALSHENDILFLRSLTNG